MAEMLKRIKEAIGSKYISIDQVQMREHIDNKHNCDEMKCRILKKNNQEYVLCSFDEKNQNNVMFPYFNSKIEGLVKMCDYILFLEEPDRLLVLLIELKSSSSPCMQLDVCEPFAVFLCERLKMVFKDFNKHYVVRKLGVKKRFRPKRTSQGYKIQFDDKRYACLPNPKQLMLKMVSDAIE